MNGINDGAHRAIIITEINTVILRNDGRTSSILVHLRL